MLGLQVECDRTVFEPIKKRGGGRQRVINQASSTAVFFCSRTRSYSVQAEDVGMEKITNDFLTLMLK